MNQQTVGYHNLLSSESGSNRVQADGALVLLALLALGDCRFAGDSRDSERFNAMLYRIVVVHLEDGRRFVAMIVSPPRQPFAESGPF
jgi:hypothetical protein